MVWLWILTGLAIIVGCLAAYFSTVEGDSSYFSLYIAGLLLGVTILMTLIPSSEDLAKKYNVDYTTAEAIHTITDIPESTIIEMIYYLELDDADLQSAFKLSDEEMTAIEILTREGK